MNRMLLFLLVPSFALAMETAKHKTAQKLAATAEGAADIAAANAREKQACVDQLSDMRYYHLHDPLLRKIYPTVVKFALMESEELTKKISLEKKQVEEGKLTERVLIGAQCELAGIIRVMCTVDHFENNVADICNMMGDKFREFTSRPSKKAVDMDVYNNLGTINSKWDELTGTTRAEMVNAHELLARRLVEKIAAPKLDEKMEKK